MQKRNYRLIKIKKNYFKVHNSPVKTVIVQNSFFFSLNSSISFENIQRTKFIRWSKQI